MSQEQSVLDKAVQKFIHHRDSIAKLNKAHKEAVGEHQIEMEKLKILLLRKLDSIGAKSLRTEHGNIVSKMSETPQCGDWEAFLDWVYENRRLDLLQKRLASTQFKDDIERWSEEAKAKLKEGEEFDVSKVLPPGITVIKEREISITKSN